MEVSESVGCVFANGRTLDYCAELEHKKSYDALNTTEQAEVGTIARDRFMAYGILKKVAQQMTRSSRIFQMISPMAATTTLLLLRKLFCCWTSTPRSRR